MNEENVVYNTTEYYSALKKDTVWLYVSAKMNLEDIMLSEISQPQNTNIAGLYLPGI